VTLVGQELRSTLGVLVGIMMHNLSSSV
jgi:hypothetical protein